MVDTTDGRAGGVDGGSGVLGGVLVCGAESEGDGIGGGSGADCDQ